MDRIAKPSSPWQEMISLLCTSLRPLLGTCKPNSINSLKAQTNMCPSHLIGILHSCRNVTRLLEFLWRPTTTLVCTIDMSCIFGLSEMNPFFRHDKLEGRGLCEGSQIKQWVRMERVKQKISSNCFTRMLPHEAIYCQ